MRGTRNQFAAFTLIELLTVFSVLVLLLFVLLPILANAKVRRQRIDCVSHLKNIGLSDRIFASDNLDKMPAQISTNKGGAAELMSDPGAVAHYFRSLSNGLATPLILICPADTRKPAQDFTSLSNTNISYFISPGTDESSPESILAGDRNIGANGPVSTTGSLILSTNSTAYWISSRHGKEQGNVALGDGSVQQINSSRLNE